VSGAARFLIAGHAMTKSIGVLAAFLAIPLALACTRKDPAAANAGDAQPTALAPSAPPSAPARGVPASSASIAAKVNPDNVPPYAGPTGSIEGRVTVIGDPAPDAKLDFSKCPEAEKVYKKVFREGAPLPDGSRPLADALIVLTGYSGFYIPEREEAKLVKIEDCAISPRTIDLTYGQRLEVQNKTSAKKLFAPSLLNRPMPALMVAPYNADPVKLWPEEGFTQLVDKFQHEFMVADVYTLLQPLHTVSKLDGTYRLDGIPVGKLEVHARLRSINRDVTKPVEIRANVVSRVDLQMEHRIADAGAGVSSSADAGKRVLIK
jgi:hypothetical protein